METNKVQNEAFARIKVIGVGGAAAMLSTA